MNFKHLQSLLILAHIIIASYNDNEGRLKTNLYDRHDDFTFPVVNFPFISMEFTFHDSYIIRELVSNTVNFWTKLSCSHKSYPNKAALLLG